MQQDDVALTSLRRHFDVPCPLGLLLGSFDRSIFSLKNKKMAGYHGVLSITVEAVAVLYSLQCIISVYLSFHTRLCAGFIIFYAHGHGRRLCSN